MTIIISNHYLSGIAMVADCRVSYGSNKTVHDGLQKLYQIGDKVILGFTGSLAGACQVIEEIRKNRKQNSKRAITASLRDVERWIRHAYKAIPHRRDQENLTFLLASVEPSRKSPIMASITPEIQTMFNFPDIPQIEMFKLFPSPKRKGELIKQIGENITIVGVCKDTEVSIREVLVNRFANQFQDSTGKETIKGCLEVIEIANKKYPETIGGGFQCAVLDSKGIRWVGYSFKNISVNLVNERYVQQDTNTGKTIPLLAIWEWRDKYGFHFPPYDSDTFNLPLFS